MRLPPKPPKELGDIGETLELMNRPDVQQFVSHANREYYHWEKIRHRPAPAGLTPEQAWAAIKLSRYGPTHRVPLKEPKGKPFSYWLPDHAMQILHDVDRGGGTTLGVGAGARAYFGAMRERLIVSSLMEEAIATSQIEGAVTTRVVAKEMLRTKHKPRNRSEQMIVNSYRTIQLLRDRLDSPLTLDLLFEIQENMTRDTLENPTGAGRLRTPADRITVVDDRDGEVLFVPPPAEVLKTRIQELLHFANAPIDQTPFIHPLVRAAILHFWLAYEHPFVDGNGRTARALFYWFMLKNGYWLFEFLTISRIILASPTQYYRSFLYSETDGNDLTYSLMFQLQATKKALLKLHECSAEKHEEQQRMAMALRKFPGLNARQRALIDHALRKPNQVYTFASHQNSHGITYVTSRNDLLDLAKRGLIQEIQSKRQRGFIAVETLGQQLGLGAASKKRRREKNAPPERQ